MRFRGLRGPQQEMIEKQGFFDYRRFVFKLIHQRSSKIQCSCLGISIILTVTLDIAATCAYTSQALSSILSNGRARRYGVAAHRPF